MAAELKPQLRLEIAHVLFVHIVGYSVALIYTWVGEKDRALEQLTTSAKIPFGVTYGELKLSPVWDPIRGDPCFEKIIASLAPK